MGLLDQLETQLETPNPRPTASRPATALDDCQPLCERCRLSRRHHRYARAIATGYG